MKVIGETYEAKLRVDGRGDDRVGGDGVEETLVAAERHEVSEKRERWHK